MTNQELIDRALNELGYHEAGATADATDSADALTVANNMLHSWKYSGKDFNWFTQDTLSDVAPLPIWAHSSVITRLARRLATTFNIIPSQQLIVDAENANSHMSRTMLVLGLTGSDMSHLPQGSSQTGHNIETDSY